MRQRAGKNQAQLWFQAGQIDSVRMIMSEPSAKSNQTAIGILANPDNKLRARMSVKNVHPRKA